MSEVNINEEYMNNKLLRLAPLTSIAKHTIYFLSRILAFLVLSYSLSGLAYSDSSFRLAVINERPEKPDFAINQYGLFHEYLSERLKQHGVEVAPLMIAGSVRELASLINDDKVDAFLEGVMPTIEIQRRTGKTSPGLLAWRKAQSQYQSVIFVRKDSPITNLQALRDKTIVFESMRSTSAYFVPKATLQAQGLSLVATTSFSEAKAGDMHYLFAGSEINQAYWVLRGRADAGAFNNGDWDRLPEIVKQDLRIIHRSKPILRWLFTFIDGLDQKTQSAVIRVLLNAHEDESGQQALLAAERIAKFEVLTVEDRGNLAYWSDLLVNIQ